MKALTKRLLKAIADGRGAFEMIQAFLSLFNTQCLTSAGLAINAASSPLAKSTAAFSAIVGGVLVYKAAGVMPALNGPAVPAGSKNIYLFTTDNAGNLTCYPGTPGATLATVAVPAIPDSTVQAVIGSVLVDNGTASTFTPNTTALDTALLTVIYANTVGPFFPVQTV